ncbi:hypothetical protein ACRWC5_20475, partial [Escherichia coli]
GNNARNGGKNSLNRLIRCVCGKKIGPDPRNFNQRVSLGRNDLLIRTFLNMKRLRERLLLTTPIRTQNQIIRKAMRELESIGYLDYQEVKKGRDIQFQIFKRSPKLALAKQG